MIAIMITNDNDNDNGRQNSNDNDNYNDKVQCEFQKEIKLKNRKKNWNSLPHSPYVYHPTGWPSLPSSPGSPWFPVSPCDKAIQSFITWLNPLAGKMKWILHSDWLPEQVRWSVGISRVGPASKYSIFGHIINPLLTKLVRSRWLNISLVGFCVFIDRDEKTKKNLAIMLIELTLDQ